jgi:hypothetical protein
VGVASGTKVGTSMSPNVNGLPLVNDNQLSVRIDRLYS